MISVHKELNFKKLFMLIIICNIFKLQAIFTENVGNAGGGRAVVNLSNTFKT